MGSRWFVQNRRVPENSRQRRRSDWRNGSKWSDEAWDDRILGLESDDEIERTSGRRRDYDQMSVAQAWRCTALSGLLSVCPVSAGWRKKQCGSATWSGRGQEKREKEKEEGRGEKAVISKSRRKENEDRRGERKEGKEGKEELMKRGGRRGREEESEKELGRQSGKAENLGRNMDIFHSSSVDLQSISEPALRLHFFSRRLFWSYDPTYY